MKFIDLFAGLGGFHLALSRLGHECVFASEIKPKLQKLYKINFPNVPIHGDITKIRVEDIPDHDILCGGFPCQPFSYAGKRMGFGDTRGTLFFEIERLLEKYRPKAFLLENVRGLYTHDKGRTFNTIMDKLHGLGYGTYDLLQNSSNFGVPQNRVRLYIVGILGATPEMGLVTDLGAADSHKYKQNSLELSLFDEKPRCRVGDVLEPEVDEKYYCSDKFQQMLHEAVGDDLSVLHGYRLIDYRGGQSLHSWELGMKGKCSDAEIRFMNALIQNRRKPIFGKEQDGKKLTLEQIKTFYTAPDIEDVIVSLLEKRYLQVNEDGKYNPVCGNMSFEVFKFLDPDSISVTLTSSDANRLGVIQHNRARHITPRECARLQGFPDTFRLHPTDSWSYKQFGNSVSVPVVEAVFNEFIKNNVLVLGWGDTNTHSIRCVNE